MKSLLEYSSGFVVIVVLFETGSWYAAQDGLEFTM
jgi:hypothetical protein